MQLSLHACEGDQLFFLYDEQRKHGSANTRAFVNKAGVGGLVDKVTSRVHKYWDKSQPSVKILVEAATKIQRYVADVIGARPTCWLAYIVCVFLVHCFSLIAGWILRPRPRGDAQGAGSCNLSLDTSSSGVHLSGLCGSY
jgi:hypothetical protein